MQYFSRLFLANMKGTKMGKTSKTKTVTLPSTTQSVLTLNGKPLVETSIKDNKLYSNYYYSPEEEKLNKYVGESFLSSLPKVNSFLPETIANMDSQISAYTQQGVNSINEIYTPMITNLENDIASRFGNFDNSIFIDNLKGIESSRAKAVSALSQDVLAKRNELVNDELENQYNYLNFLANYQNQSFQNMLNASKFNQSNLSLNTDYLTDYYGSKNSSNPSWSQLSSYLSTLTKLL